MHLQAAKNLARCWQTVGICKTFLQPLMVVRTQSSKKNDFFKVRDGEGKKVVVDWD